MAPQTSPSPEPPTYLFSPRELQRLAAYRAAVVARFYTDECDTAEGSPRFAPAKPARIRRIGR
ncbi:MAG: hypothetical protein JO020_27235 [Chloroflexi bacterium]|nr:hypothetical protein [Chloroflexota bacterium]